MSNVRAAAQAGALRSGEVAASEGLGEKRSSDAPEAGVGGAGPAPNPWVLEIAPYKGGEARIDGASRVLKLSANENPMGPSPRAVEAYRRGADGLGVYPDGSAAALRGAIAAVHGIDADRIVCGAGSDEIIGLLCMAFCAPGDEIVHTAHGFAMYRIYGLGVGARPVSAPETQLRADPDAILGAVTPKTKIVFLANPNNPTGTYLSSAELRHIVEGLDPNVLFVIDGAYAEYMRAEDYEDGFALVDAFPNVVATRTFSKIHGLAALRLGYCYAPEVVVDALNRVRGPFNASAPALAAGEAAVQDVAYAEACAIQNEVWRDWLTKELRRIGLDCHDTAANFVLPHFGVTGPRSAAAADAFLRSRGIIARRMESYGLPGHLRITIGSSSDTVAVARALKDFVADAAEARG